MRIRPAPSEQPAMPVQQHLWLHQERAPRAARQHPAERQQQSVVCSNRGRPACRRRIDSSCRSTKISNSFRAITAGDEHDLLEQAADDDGGGWHKAKATPSRRDARRYRRRNLASSFSDRVSAPHGATKTANRRRLGASWLSAPPRGVRDRALRTTATEREPNLREAVRSETVTASSWRRQCGGRRFLPRERGRSLELPTAVMSSIQIRVCSVRGNDG
jgi:hypothetical protein